MARARRAALSRVGSPPPTSVSVRESGDSVTVVAMRWAGPSAESAAAVVAIFTVDAGVMGVAAPRAYNCLPVDASTTTAVRTEPRAGASSSGPSAVSRALAPAGAVSPAVAPGALRTAGALGAGAGPSGAVPS